MVRGCTLIARARTIAVLLALTGALSGCSDPARQWTPDLVPASVAAPVSAEPRDIPRCRSMPESVAAEAAAQTPIEALRDGGSQALSAALIASEARKNHRLREAIDAYQVCAALQTQKSPASISRAGL